MCTEDDFKSLPLNTLPEMQRTDLSNSVLMLKALGIDNLVRFEFPSSPPSKNLIASLEVLYALGALDDTGKLTKPLGEQMAEFPIHPSLSVSHYTCVRSDVIARSIRTCTAKTLLVIKTFPISENAFNFGRVWLQPGNCYHSGHATNRGRFHCSQVLYFAHENPVYS